MSTKTKSFGEDVNKALDFIDKRRDRGYACWLNSKLHKVKWNPKHTLMLSAVTEWTVSYKKKRKHGKHSKRKSSSRRSNRV